MRIFGVVMAAAFVIGYPAYGQNDVVGAAEDASVSEEAALPTVTVVASEEVLSRVPKAPTTVDDFVALTRAIVAAAKAGQWVVMAGLIIMFVVWLFVFVLRQFFPTAFTSSKGKKALPWVSIGLSLLFGVGVGLAAGLSWYNVIFVGFASGLAAIGGWEALFKHILPKHPKKE